MSAKQKIQEMKTNIRAAYKSDDTEEWFDKVFTKPLGYLWAMLFMKIGWTPNMVTIAGMLIGAAGGVLFYFEPFYLRLIGVLLVIWANIFDSTDGQIARLTGQKSQLGRILDGVCTIFWYCAIYPALAFKLMRRNIPFTEFQWSWWIWAVILINFLSHAKQCRMADYYRNLHLFFLKNNNGDDWDRSSTIKPAEAGTLFEKIYLVFYKMYTVSQEKATPCLQALMNAIEETGAPATEEVRNAYLTRSRKYIQLTNILTFNARAYTMFVCVLLNMPLLYFAMDLVVFGVLNRFMCSRYEKIARDVHKECKLPGWENVKHRINYKPFFFVIGLAGVVVMVLKMDMLHLDWEMILHRLPILLPASIGVFFFVYVFHALGQWAVIGRNTNGLGFFKLLRITFSTFALNSVTPVSFAGGEPFKIMEMQPYLGTAAATANAFSFTIMNGLSLLSLCAMGSATYFALFGFTANTLRTVLMLLVFVISVVVLALVLFPKRTGVLRALMRFFEKLPLFGSKIAAFNARYSKTITEIDTELTEFKNHPVRLWLSFLCEHMTRMFEIAEFFVIYRLLGADVTYAQAIVIVTITAIIGNILFVIPMQLGAREGGLALSASWCSIDDGISLTVSLFARFREVFYAILGVMLIMIGNKKKEKAQ